MKVRRLQWVERIQPYHESNWFCLHWTDSLNTYVPTVFPLGSIKCAQCPRQDLFCEVWHLVPVCAVVCLLRSGCLLQIMLLSFPGYWQTLSRIKTVVNRSCPCSSCSTFLFYWLHFGCWLLLNFKMEILFPQTKVGKVTKEVSAVLFQRRHTFLKWDAVCFCCWKMFTRGTCLDLKP